MATYMSPPLSRVRRLYRLDCEDLLFARHHPLPKESYDRGQNDNQDTR